MLPFAFSWQRSYRYKNQLPKWDQSARWASIQWSQMQGCPKLSQGTWLRPELLKYPCPPYQHPGGVRQVCRADLHIHSALGSNESLRIAAPSPYHHHQAKGVRNENRGRDPSLLLFPISGTEISPPSLTRSEYKVLQEPWRGSQPRLRGVEEAGQTSWSHWCWAEIWSRNTHCQIKNAR